MRAFGFAPLVTVAAASLACGPAAAQAWLDQPGVAGTTVAAAGGLGGGLPERDRVVLVGRQRACAAARFPMRCLPAVDEDAGN
jgi:hypothetical protein